jgi:hypothetical protein
VTREIRRVFREEEKVCKVERALGTLTRGKTSMYLNKRGAAISARFLYTEKGMPSGPVELARGFSMTSLTASSEIFGTSWITVLR